jgi:preprotein translocase subunit YajC
VDALLFPLLLIAVFVVLVVLPTRARNRQVRQMQSMQAQLTLGTEVMTSSGMYGRVVALWEDEVDLEVAPGVVTTWARMAIREVRSPARTLPTRDEEAGLPDEEAD